jgi:hypothetical protein
MKMLSRTSVVVQNLGPVYRKPGVLNGLSKLSHGQVGVNKVNGSTDDVP